MSNTSHYGFHAKRAKTGAARPSYSPDDDSNLHCSGIPLDLTIPSRLYPSSSPSLHLEQKSALIRQHALTDSRTMFAPEPSFSLEALQPSTMSQGTFARETFHHEQHEEPFVQPTSYGYRDNLLTHADRGSTNTSLPFDVPRVSYDTLAQHQPGYFLNQPDSSPSFGSSPSQPVMTTPTEALIERAGGLSVAVTGEPRLPPLVWAGYSRSRRGQLPLNLLSTLPSREPETRPPSHGSVTVSVTSSLTEQAAPLPETSLPSFSLEDEENIAATISEPVVNSCFRPFTPLQNGHVTYPSFLILTVASEWASRGGCSPAALFRSDATQHARPLAG